MHIIWRNEPAREPETPNGATRVAVSVDTVIPDDAAAHDLETLFLDAATRLGAALANGGASPAHIRALTIRVPDATAFEAKLPDMSLLYREALAGNFGDVALVGGAETVGLDAVAFVPAEDENPVYKAFDRAALNAQYSPRASVPETPEILRRWREHGTAHQPKRSAELAYGADHSHRVDLYMPDGVDRPPLHVFLHGGYWQALDKRDNAHLTRELVDRGVAVAVPNYTLCPPGTVGDIVVECRQAIAHLTREAGEHGYDASRLSVSGHSAGGHLAAMMAATVWPMVDPDLPHDLVKGTVAISGLFDLEPLRHTGINAALGLTRYNAQELSPILCDPISRGPFIAAVGGAESDEFKRQSEAFTKRWSARGTPIRYMEVPDRNHFTVVEALADPDSPLFEAALEVATYA
jgi:arylformamidase